jgi:hypothetical protein
MEIYASGFLRPMLLPVVIIAYILAIAPPMAQGQPELVRKFRPLVLVDDEVFNALVETNRPANPRGEWIAFGTGALLGILNVLSWVEGDFRAWTQAYLIASFSLMFGLLAWTIYSSITSTRLLTALHRLPLQIDLFDTKPFQPVGQYSLRIALAYIGGIFLSLFFGLNPNNLYAWQSWLVQVSLALIAVLIFFLSMRDTHRVLAAEKQRNLSLVRERIKPVRRNIQQQVEAGERIDNLAGEFNALLAYEARLQSAPTWPYNTGMARALFFAVCLPLLMRLASVALFER